MGRAERVVSAKGAIAQSFRRLRLEVLSRLVRPFLHLREGETISFAERQADLTLARLTRRVLGHTGLTSQTVCTSFGVMHYYDSAPGSAEPPLVMIHGIGSSGQCFLMLAEAIRRHRRVILPDLFHFSGFSEPNNPVMNVEEHMCSLKEMFKEIGVTSCDVVGLSLGGWIAQRLAISSPSLVNRMMLLNAAGLRFGTILLRDRLLTLSWEKFQKLYSGVLYAPPYRDVYLVSPIVRRSLFRLLKDHSVRNFLRSIRPSDFMEPYLAQISCPVMVLWGDRDTFLSHQAPHFFIRHLRQAKGFYVEDCAHILVLEAPYNCLEHMNDFFELNLDMSAAVPQLLLKAFGRYEEREIQSAAEQKPASGDEAQGYRLSG